MNHPN
jgi:hypothetical protein